MSSGQPDGTRRLRGAGVGSVVGGIALGVLSFLVPYAVASGLVLALGVAVWGYGRRTGSDFGSRSSVGIAAVGGIGLAESLGAGLGVGPLLLAALAVGAGLVDVLLGALFGALRGSSGEEREDPGVDSQRD